MLVERCLRIGSAFEVARERRHEFLLACLGKTRVLARSTALGSDLSTLVGFGQNFQDSTIYKNRKLKIEEVNFVSSYYKQDGNNSAVTGGIGTEHLTDFAITLDVKIAKYDRRSRKHTITGEIGVDVYSSASSDKIDPNTISSASSGDKRIYPSLTYAIANEAKGSTFSINGSKDGFLPAEGGSCASTFLKSS